MSVLATTRPAPRTKYQHVVCGWCGIEHRPDINHPERGKDCQACHEIHNPPTCKNGHPRTAENTYEHVRDDGRSQVMCRQCRRDNDKKSRTAREERTRA